ncbi:MAG TPA: MFS transporter [Pirellulaceae bacterium]|nr:MFS transporter [Pirellulaceae bacterium]HMO91163.1 MFS transporter [Pirellulaceae bacterium]HMP69067.1 MFS transporter [Pirellulaceae bacterium]
MSKTISNDEFAGNAQPSRLVFWGCFIALITTAFAFITRVFMVNTPEMWPRDFGLDKVQQQVLFGHGIWPFAVSIILFSLVIDRVGYRFAMIFSFLCYAVYTVLALVAYGFVSQPDLQGDALAQAREKGLYFLTIGSIVLGLGNGTVEAFINPVVATIYSREKTKWLNILHAGWPGGLVLGGLLTLLLGQAALENWRLLIYIIAIPAIVYLLMLLPVKFPVNERVTAGASYKQMLAEFGVIGAAIAAFLILKQLGMTFGLSDWIVYALLFIVVIAYGLYCQSLGRPMMIFLCLIMMPLATTELGTDAAITGIMEGPMKAQNWSPLWVLIYTSAIMMVLRFFAGPVVKTFTPLGLLAVCCVLAIIGLYFLSITETFIAIFAAATLYGIGKTYFWPTMLGVVSEQYPKGGALTLNAIAGIGMLTVGIIGGPLIGHMQETSAQAKLEAELPGVYETISKPDSYLLSTYTAIDDDKVKQLPTERQAEIESLVKTAKQRALAKVTVFPAFMLACYLILIVYFVSKGGYRPSGSAGH